MEAWEREAEATGRVRETYANRPHPADHLELPWTLFQELSRCRQIGMAASAIAPSDVLAHFELRGVPTALRPWCYWLIQVLDAEFMAWKGDSAGGNDRTSSA